MNSLHTKSLSKSWAESGGLDTSPKEPSSQRQSESVTSYEDTSTTSYEDTSTTSYEDTSATGSREANTQSSWNRNKHSSQGASQEINQAIAAERAARYYSECYIQGVGGSTANHAAQTVQENYKKWWLQKFDGCNHNADKSPMFGFTPSEHTSALVSEDEVSSASGKERAENTECDHDSSSNIQRRISSHNRVDVVPSNSLPSNQYFSVTDHDFTPIGGPANAVAMVLLNEEELGPGINSSDVNLSTFSPPLQLTNVRNEKKRQHNDINQSDNLRFNLKRGDNNYAKEVKLSQERDLKYMQASTFEKYMNKSQDFLHKASGSPIDPKTSPYYEKTKLSDNFSFQQLDERLSAIIASKSPLNERRAKQVDSAKLSLVHALAVSGGDVKSKEFIFALHQLRSLFLGTNLDAREVQRSVNKSIEGTWLCLSRPHFKECLGENSAGEYMYTMGRMSFDMFAPTNLVCSIQCVFNTIERVDVKDLSKVVSIPRDLHEEVLSGRSILRTYNIITAFTIEPDSPTFDEYSPNKLVSKALQGLFTVQGYILPDPKVPNRFSIWFSGGEVVANESNERDIEEWMKIFQGGSWKRHLYEKARLLAARLLLGAEVPEGMDPDGSMRFKLNRPIGGHGTAYVDVLYLDETLRVVRGHHGSLFVFSRVSS